MLFLIEWTQVILCALWATGMHCTVCALYCHRSDGHSFNSVHLCPWYMFFLLSLIFFSWSLLLLLILFSYLAKNFKILMGNSVRGLLKLPTLILIPWWQLDGPSQEWSQAMQKGLCTYHWNRLGRHVYHFWGQRAHKARWYFKFLTLRKKLCGEGWSWLIGNFAQKKIRRVT